MILKERAKELKQQDWEILLFIYGEGQTKIKDIKFYLDLSDEQIENSIEKLLKCKIIKDINSQDSNHFARNDSVFVVIK